MGLKIEYLTGDGEDYPLIRIFGRDPAAVGHLIAGIKEQSPDGSPKALHMINGISALNCLLSVVISEREAGGVHANGKDNAFLWILSNQRRKVVAGLLAPFEAPSPLDAFQWLSGPRATGDAGRGVGLVITTDDLGRW